MGGRFPMAGQTTSSWPSAKTLQSTNTRYSQQARAIIAIRFTGLPFYSAIMVLGKIEQQVRLFIT